jgi:cytochrome c oxidase cbb3-type subunit III
MKGRKDEMLDHEFDGIREYNNPPPKWIMYILYGSLVFAVAYWLAFHTYGIGRLPANKYEVEMARAAEAQLAKMGNQEVSDQSLQLMASIPATVTDGQQIFQQFCVVCHAEKGTGIVGPNLTDPYWIHGGKPLQILQTVTTGVPDKGMVAWGDQLGPARVRKVVAYVLTLKGQNLPGKAPQGVIELPESGAPNGQPPVEQSPVTSPETTAARGKTAA